MSLVSTKRRRPAILCLYQMTTSMRDRIRAAIDSDCEFITLANMSLRGGTGVFQFLRLIRNRRLYFLETDPSLSAVTPLLRTISLFAMSTDWYLLREEFRPERCSRLIVFRDIFRLVAMFALSIFVFLNIYTKLKFLRPQRDDSKYVKSDTKKILYIRGNLWFGVRAGGAISHVRGIVEGILRTGVKVDLVSSSNEDTVFCSPNLMKLAAPLRTFILPKELSHVTNVKNIVNLLTPKMSHYDAIYERLSLCGVAGVFLSREYNIPLIIEYNGSEIWISKNWGGGLVFEKIALMFEDKCLGAADVIVAVSEPLRQELVRRGVNKKKIIVQPNGVDVSEFDSGRFNENTIRKFRTQYFGDDEGHIVTFVGTFGAWHGASVLAAVLDESVGLPSKFVEKHNVHFLFVGDGPNRKSLESSLMSSPMHKYCHFIGLLEPSEVPLCLAASDILVAPQIENTDGTEFFGSPTKIFEYMASGRAIIASDLGQIKEVMGNCPELKNIPIGDDKVTRFEAFGIRVLPGSSGQLAQAIKYLVENPNVRTFMGLNARNQALRNHTWGQRANEIIGSLADVRAGKSASVKPVRLLVNALHSKSGGGVTYLRNILPILARDVRFDVHICIHEKQFSVFDECLDGITVHLADTKPNLLSLLYFEQCLLHRMIRKIGADVTYSPANYGPLFVRNHVLLLRNALNVAFFDWRPSKVVYWIMLYFGTILSLLSSKRAIAVSAYARGAATGGAVYLLKKKCEIVPHGISSLFSTNENQPRKECELLFVSDVYIQKNLHGLIKSIVKIADKFPNLTLRIAGSPIDTKYLEKLKRGADELGVTSRINFVGNVNPRLLAKFYRECTLFVFPSTVETFGNPLVEAMACGCPIACSSSAAMPEIAGDAVAYFDPNDVTDISRVIIDLLGDPGHREELGRRALERSKLYSWEETARRTSEILLQAARN